MQTEKYLKLLKQRNKEMEIRYSKLQALEQKIDYNIENVQNVYESFLLAEEEVCKKMTEFDKEYKVIRRKLFPPPSQRKCVLKKREENKNYILEQLYKLKKLNEDDCIEELVNTDTVLCAVTKDVDTWNEFIEKYESFLIRRKIFDI